MKVRVKSWGLGLIVIALVAAGAAPVAIVLHVSGARATPGSGFGDQLEAFASTATDIVTFTGAIGLLTMAVIEVAKRLVRVRGYFQRWRLGHLLGLDRSSLVASIMPTGVDKPRPRSSGTVAWFDVPADQLIAQIGEITTQLLDRLMSTIGVETPEDGRDWAGEAMLAVLLHFSSYPKLTEWAKAQVAAQGDPAPSPGWRLRSLFARPSVPPGERVRVAQREQLEVHLRSQLDRELDRVHIVLANDWSRLLRVASCLVAGTIAAAVLLTTGTRDVGLTAVTVLAASVLGGFFSWVARDIAATIARWRGP